MATSSEWDCVLLTDGNGAVYQIPLPDLAQYQLPPDEAEEMLEGDVQGFGEQLSINFAVIRLVPGPAGRGPGGIGGGPHVAGGPVHGGWDVSANKKL